MNDKRGRQTVYALQAGAAKADITPEAGTQIDGDIGRHRPMDGVLDHIFARALVLEQAAKMFCMLSLDLLAITREWTEAIRSMALERFSIEPDAVAVHVTQSILRLPWAGSC